MLGLGGRAIFSLAAVSPLLMVIFINYVLDCQDFIKKIAFIISGIFIFIVSLICSYIYIKVCTKRAALSERFKNITLVRNNPLLFVLVYIVPLISGNSLSFAQLLVLGIFLFMSLLIIKTVAISPIIAVLGYYVYQVESSSGCNFLLLSKKRFLSTEKEIHYTRIDYFTFVEV